MGNLKLFTVSAVIFLASCGSEDQEQNTQDGQADGTDGSLIEGVVTDMVDSSEMKAIYGTWQILQINDKKIQKGEPLFGLKQTFMPDRAWFISMPQEDTITLVEGGKWSYDINSRQINIFFTADSIPKTVVLDEINQKKMILTTVEGVRQSWTKIASKK